MTNEEKNFYNFSKKVFNGLFLNYYNAQIIGKENIPKDGPIIIAGNHRNLYDPCLVYISTDRKINYLAKKEVFDNKTTGWMFKKMGCIPINRSKVNHSSMKKALDILNNGGAVGIFPEGTRNKTQDILLPFKTGAVSMAKKTDAYIIPFGRTGDYKFKSKNLIIRFGEPFKVKDLSLQEANKKLSNEIQSLIETNICKIESVTKNVLKKEKIDIKGEG